MKKWIVNVLNSVLIGMLLHVGMWSTVSGAARKEQERTLLMWTGRETVSHKVGLHQAVITGDVEDVRQILGQRGIDVNSTSAPGEMLVQNFVRGESQLARVVNYTMNTLVALSKNGKSEDIDILEAGARDIGDLFLNQYCYQYGMTPLHLAVITDHAEIIELLLLRETPADVAIKDNFGRFPISYVRSMIALSLLVEHGASAEVLRQKKRDQLLRNVTCWGCDDVIRLGLVIEHLSDSGAEFDNSLLEKAIINGRINVVQSLGNLPGVELVAELSNLSQEDKNCLLRRIAMKGGPITLAEDILLAGAQVDAADNMGCTPLDCAIRGRHAEIIETVLNAGASLSDLRPCNKQIYISDMIAHGLLQRVRDFCEATPADFYEQGGPYELVLCEAAQKGSLEVIDMLLSAGAHVEFTSSCGYTPLVSAVTEMRSREIVLKLLKAGVPAGEYPTDLVNTDTKYGRSALECAIESGSKFNFALLVLFGAEPCVRDKGAKRSVSGWLEHSRVGARSKNDRDAIFKLAAHYLGMEMDYGLEDLNEYIGEVNPLGELLILFLRARRVDLVQGFLEKYPFFMDYESHLVAPGKTAYAVASDNDDMDGMKLLDSFFEGDRADDVSSESDDIEMMDSSEDDCSDS